MLKKHYILNNLNKIECDFKSGSGFGKKKAVMLTIDAKS